MNKKTWTVLDKIKFHLTSEMYMRETIKSAMQAQIDSDSNIKHMKTIKHMRKDLSKTNKRIKALQKQFKKEALYEEQKLRRT